MEQFLMEFIKKGIKRGGVYMFDSKDAFEIINKCKINNVKILGIDSFKLTEQTTQPVLEHSVDFSILEEKFDCWLEAEKFIKERINKGFFFEIVYDYIKTPTEH